MRLIDCEEFIRLLNAEKAKYCSANYKQMRRGLCKAIRIAHEMDNEDAEPVRHGRWELETSKYLRRCSACEKVTFYRGAGRYYDYCPNCGAKMDLEVQE